MSKKLTSRQKFVKYHTVDKRYLTTYIVKKLGGQIDKVHIAAVIQIILDTLIEDLWLGKIVKIKNLGSIYIKKSLIGPIRHVLTKELLPGKQEKTLMYFKMDKKLRTKLMEYLIFDEKKV